jgi:phospholipid/cholesterol/gamma-HCH transport system substrate-binding protein
MDERIVRFRVGAVVVAGAVVTVVLVMLFGAGPNVLQRTYQVNIKFPEAPGVTVDTPVRKSGVLIGRVSEVKLLEEGGVLVSVKIQLKNKLRQNETCRVSSGGSILGDAVLEFVPSGNDELLARFDRNHDKVLDEEERKLSRALINDGDLLNDGVVANNPLRVLVNLEKDVQGALASVQGAGIEVSELARTFNQTFGGNKQQFQQIITKTDRALDSFDRTMSAMETVLGDKELLARLQEALKGVPDFLAETRTALGTARDTMVAFQRVSQKAETNLDNIESFTKPLREHGGQMVDNVERSTENLNELLAQLVAFAQAMNTTQGTLGKLVHDDELYQKIAAVASNAEELSKRLGPILTDIRIFSDKIAREPRQLGVSGALDRRPPGTGLKTGYDFR